jgi:hypothetical protein
MDLVLRALYAPRVTVHACSSLRLISNDVHTGIAFFRYLSYHQSLLPLRAHARSAPRPGTSGFDDNLVCSF